MNETTMEKTNTIIVMRIWNPIDLGPSTLMLSFDVMVSRTIIWHRNTEKECFAMKCIIFLQFWGTKDEHLINRKNVATVTIVNNGDKS